MAQLTTIPGAQGISEWQSPINGFIATCVQAAEAVITGIYGILPTNPQSTTRLAWDQIARGEASPRGGASIYWSASAQLNRLGIPNTVRDPQWVASHNWVAAINAALATGTPVLIGVNDATNLRDARTGQMPDVGVFGHGLTIVGADQYGYLVADPNTAPGSPFQHYTAEDLRMAGLDSLVIPNEPPPAVTSLSADGLLPGGQRTLPQLFSNPLQLVLPSSIPKGLKAAGKDLAIRGILITAGLVLLVVGLIGFLFAGSGRQATGEAVKGAAKGAATAAMA